MALIAVRAVVDIAMHTLVMLVCLLFRVTDRAGKHRVVRWIRVAVAARLCISVVHGEPGVVEFGVQPCLLMTGITVGGKVVVVIVDVALAAEHLNVRAGQRPTGCAVIELAISPEHRVMAHLALLRESGGLVGGLLVWL